MPRPHRAWTGGHSTARQPYPRSRGEDQGWNQSPPVPMPAEVIMDREKTRALGPGERVTASARPSAETPRQPGASRGSPS